jgi:hypothetical protein
MLQPCCNHESSVCVWDGGVFVNSAAMISAKFLTFMILPSKAKSSSRDLLKPLFFSSQFPCTHLVTLWQFVLDSLMSDGRD